MADANDPITHGKFSLLLRGGPFDDLFDLGVAVFPAERGADPLEVQTHLDIEVLVRFRREVACMWIVDVGDSGQRDFEDVIVGCLTHPLLEAAVPAMKTFDRSLVRPRIGGRFGV